VVRFDLRPTSLHSGLHIATAPFADEHMVRLSSPGLVSTQKDSDCYLTQHGRLGMNQVPVQEGGFARRAEVLCFLSPRAGPEKPMFHAHLSVVRWTRNRRSTCTTKITYLGSVSMTTFPKKSAKVVRSNIKSRLDARERPLRGSHFCIFDDCSWPPAAPRLNITDELALSSP
jgi:hypothetical protein